jgi:hypothetical protein
MNNQTPAQYTDAQRLDWIAHQFRTCTVYMSGQHPYSPTGTRLRHLTGPTFRAAIDKELEGDGIKPAAPSSPT